MRHTTTTDLYRRLRARMAGHSTARLLSECVGPLMIGLDGQLWWGDSREDYAGLIAVQDPAR